MVYVEDTPGFTGWVAQKAAEVSKCREQKACQGTWELSRRLEWLKYLDWNIWMWKNEILNVLAREKGCSRHNAMLSEYVPVRMLLRYYIKKSRKILRDENRSRPFSLNFGNKRVIVRKEPLGVVGVISPFNFPFSLPLAPVVSALLAGNAVILKPSEVTPETNSLVEELIVNSLYEFDARGLFAVLPARRDFGPFLVSSLLVDKIHFTGSVEAGWKIVEANARVRLTPPTLELGGSNPAIVLEDADLETTASDILFSRFSGLNCNSIKRVFVVRELFEPLARKLSDWAGWLLEHELIRELPEHELMNYRRFLADVNGHDDMDFVPARPMVLKMESYDPQRLVLKEETFCPILPVVMVKDEEEAVRFANDSQFGLGASVYTHDKARFRRVAAQLNAGVVSHNAGLVEFAQPQVPFGGRKNSGWGFTHGPEGLLDFVQKKTVIEEKFSAPKLHHYPWTRAKEKWLGKFIDLVIRLS